MHPSKDQCSDFDRVANVDDSIENEIIDASRMIGPGSAIGLGRAGALHQRHAESDWESEIGARGPSSP